ncbi:hypothetical protein Lalb_Chr01g0015381 [Lupinus albus]|uniref:Uncharacterized protein n=1 Tax=Lupinus albus TaxID=3870 RepID=A0A6A4R7U4_LUPAL|nr:hypothetical protein Lalb_Chr01g0015381 [Lupinus albus]
MTCPIWYWPLWQIYDLPDVVLAFMAVVCLVQCGIGLYGKCMTCPMWYWSLWQLFDLPNVVLALWKCMTYPMWYWPYGDV